MSAEEILKEQEANQAPPPAFLKSVINQSKEEPKVEKGVTEEKVLKELSQSDAWKVIKRYIEAKQMQYAAQLRQSIGEASIEEVGFRFLITDMVNDFGSSLINYVERPTKAAEYGESLRSNNKDREKDI